jgi:L-threonylcarbamoyladenylate synthase
MAERAGSGPRRRLVVSAPERLDFRADPDADLDPVVRHLEGGGLIAYPTETVYGLGGAATPEAVARVLHLKGREPDKPLLVLVAERRAAAGLRWTPAAEALADAFWPGALTLVLADPDGIFPRGVRHDRTGSVGVRVSPHPWVARLVAAWGGPITSTSLNEPGGPPARSGSEALEVAERLGGKEILVIDTGTLPPSRPSTMVDCSGTVPVVLRAGSVPVERLRCVIPEIHERPPA